jgi:hypothetical protein
MPAIVAAIVLLLRASRRAARADHNALFGVRAERKRASGGMQIVFTVLIFNTKGRRKTGALLFQSAAQ